MRAGWCKVIFGSRAPLAVSPLAEGTARLCDAPSGLRARRLRGAAGVRFEANAADTMFGCVFCMLTTVRCGGGGGGG